MTISNALNNALSGLTAAARSAEVVSSNLSNALTEGYGRRVLDLSSQQVGGRGAGVRIDGVSRLVDRGVIADRRLADAAVARYDTTTTAVRRIEDLIGTSSGENGILARLAAVEEAFISSSASPGSDVRLKTTVDRLKDLTGALNDASDLVQQSRVDADARIAVQVDTLNTSLKQVEALNADIFRARQTGTDPSALLDARQLAIDRISEIVPVTELQRSSDSVALMTTSGQILLDGPAAEIGFVPRGMITADMTLASGALDGLTLNGDPVSSPPFGKLGGGSLAADFELRDNTLVSFQQRLDELASDLISRFEDSGVDPTLTAGNPGLLTDNGNALDLTDTDGLAGRISLNASVDPDQGGDLWRLRDGIEAPAAGPTGSTSQINNWLDGLSALRPSASGANLSASGFFGNLVAEIGRTRVSNEDELSFATARWETLKQAEYADGVDTDYEMQMLLRIEEAYSANAKVIETVNIMMRTLMEI